MRRCLDKQIFNIPAGVFSLIIWSSLGTLLWAGDLPSGLPDDMSDMSAFNPCLGTLWGASPPRCPWYVQADGLFIKRDRIDSVNVATLANPNNSVFSTDNINSPFRGGPRLLVGHTLGDSRWQIDGTYFLLDSWNDSAAIYNFTSNPIPPGGQGNLFSPFTNFGQPASTAYDYNYFVSIRELSQLQNGELNLRYLVPMPHECLTVKFLLGLRYMSINEQFDYYAASMVHTPLSISTRTTNDLVGPQIGGEFYFFATPQCWIDLGIKGALCNDRALQDTNGTLSGPVVASRKACDATAYVGDLDLSLVWQITPHWLTRIGYQAIWVNNIAMAARNFGQPASILVNGPPQIDTIGRAVYHGPHVGLEVSW